MKAKFLIVTALAATIRLSAIDAKDKEEAAQRLDSAATVLNDIMGAPDKGIPEDLLEKAHYVVIVPSLKKGAFIVGAQYGKGFFTCRTAGAGWSAPAAIRVEGGSVGFQIGGAENEVVMLVMNERGAQRLLSSQFTLGGEGEVAAGPVGRTATAQTDAKFTAEILSWSRSRGVFAGVALKGATLREDKDENEAVYGRRLENKALINDHVPAPPAAARLLSLLQKYSAHEKK